MTYALIAVLVVVAVYMYVQNRDKEPVAVAAVDLGTDGEIDAIEYFWRPG